MKAEILVGDVRSRLAEIPDKSVQCVVTSPPYWGLRDYGNDGQIGLEQTPQEYIDEMVSVFREVRRVLADDGVLWLNIGDCYATKQFQNIKPKDLVGIPWRLAFALQDDGWYLRQDIIWAKPNPMPESVRDRCTKSHEYIFMLTKSSRYFFDNEAIKEPSVSYNPKHQQKSTINNIVGNMSDRGVTRTTEGLNLKTQAEKTKEFRNRRDVWFIPTKPFKGAHFAVMPEAIVEPCVLASSRTGDTVLDPFTGSGTVAVVALRHGRNYVGTELNPEYADIAINRITEAVGGLINDVVLS